MPFLVGPPPHRRLASRFPRSSPVSALGLAGRPAPSNRITLAVIGTGNQGFNDIKSFLRDERVQLVAVCDVNRESAGYWDGKVGGREPARRLVDEHYAEKGSSETHHACDADRRLPRDPRPTRYRCRRNLYSRSLARAHGRRGVQGQERHLLPETPCRSRSPKVAR